MPTTDPVIAARNKLASLSKWSPDDHAAINDARRALTEAKLERHVREALAAAPPLTDDQRSRIARLLTGGGRVGLPSTNPLPGPDYKEKREVNR